MQISVQAACGLTHVGTKAFSCGLCVSVVRLSSVGVACPLLGCLPLYWVECSVEGRSCQMCGSLKPSPSAAGGGATAGCTF